ncbi:alpha,alpha-trehalose phosphate synthase-like protein subunit [Byssothecium circinans]|uniref:Alpha,alpha-trehalose phosphate synthase-like protein subunit n=1 Tax=Byssothecium circinans TaxID=147558 RepID=A0A6A5TBR7_9PLEO|nr:alpha,alpha-trehalose phosphate synthase-like protein subunit [Byssothecium circinans]
MTTFVVSLFLPYTVDFNEPEETPPAVAERTSVPVETPPSLQEFGRQPSTGSIHTRDVSSESLLLEQQRTGKISLPRTPAAMMEQEDYFTPGGASASTHFLRPKDPRSLVRSDAHVPEWGATYFNQPRPKADLTIPDTILEYAKAQERAEARRDRSRARAKSLYKSKGVDPRWEQGWEVVPAVQGNGGLSNAIRASVENGTFKDVITVGTVGFPTDALDEEKKTEIYEKLEEEHKALSVFISDKDYDGHYSHYCKTILWPVFHYVIPDHPKSKAFLDHSWVFYVAVNQAFADKVVKNYKRGDVIWVHDYHLCLVPSMIRQKLPDAKIGFFLHTAFPSSEVFRCLAARKELLEGMLGANLVAFQTREYAHHFLQTCSRILAVEATEDGVQLESRFVNVFNSPIGIDPMALTQAREDAEVKEWVDIMLKRYKGKHVIVARDKLDNIRGVRQKLLAFELFLKKNPQWVEQVVLIQVATSTREDNELASTVSDIVTRIDANYSTLAHNPLVFLRQDIAFSQYLALLSVADALCITSLREGMNLTCHEFVICQDGRYEETKKHAPVILSEFTGSAAIFEGAELAVNPWDYQGIADAFKVSLEMSAEEKERRYEKMHNMVYHHTGDFWMRNLVDHLTKVFDEQFSRDTMTIPRLSVSDLIARYEATWRRLIILDYEGTLAPYGAVKKTVLTSNDKINDVLSELVTDDKNAVYIMSGRTVEELELLFDRIPGLGLIAENGCFLREPRSSDWLRFPKEEQVDRWMDAIKQILQYYVERVEGSWVEERDCSLIFHYETTNQPELAQRQAGECANHINDAAEQQRVRAIPTKCSVIIEPSDFDKSTAAQHIFANYPPSALPEFLFVAGNDRDDETVFKWAKHLKDTGAVSDVQTVTVGERNSLALSTLTNGSTGLLSVLAKLSKIRTR